MGTRNLTLIVADGAFKIAQYCQWDGYPGGQGADALEFLRTGFDREKFLAGLAHAFEPTDEQRNAMWKKVGVDIVKTNGMVPFDKSKKFVEIFPTLHRDTGAKILPLIQAATEPFPVDLATGFAGDSLFCEWAYVIDLDQNVFEVYEGFNKVPTPADSRFPSGADWLEKTDNYEPVALKKSYPLDALPDLDTFLADLEPVEDDEVEAAE